MRCAFRHASPSTGRAETAALARERHESVLATAAAVHTREAVGQDSAMQVAEELPAYTTWKGCARLNVLAAGEEAAQVLRQHAVQHAVLGPSADARRPAAGCRGDLHAEGTAAERDR